MGRRKIEVTDYHRGLVAALSGAGIPQDVICRILDLQPGKNRLQITKNTLRVKFKDELENGMVIANGMVMNTAFHQAISGDTPAMTMFWLKTRCGWRETGPVDDSPESTASRIREFLQEADNLREKKPEPGPEAKSE